MTMKIAVGDEDCEWNMLTCYLDRDSFEFELSSIYSCNNFPEHLSLHFHRTFPSLL